MHPFIIPAVIAVALVGLFLPGKEEKTDDDEIPENGGKRGGGGGAGKPLSDDPDADGGQSQLVKPGNVTPITKDNSDVEKPDSDHATAPDLRNNQPPDDSGGQPVAAPGNGQAEPVTDPASSAEKE